jgi:uncharacterized protein (DUF4415 family)
MTDNVGKTAMPKPSARDEARRRALANLADMTDEEDAAITADALADPDNPPADDLIRRRGRPALASPKEAVKLRLDAEVLSHFRATGSGWQTRMNEALRKAAGLK